MSNTKLHVLTGQSSNLEATLPRIIAFSNAIFSADTSSKYASITYWRDRLSSLSSVIIYLTSSDAESEAEAVRDANSPITPIAFLFAHPRTHAPPLRSGHTVETLHVWLAGVSPDYRKAGCLQRMMDAIPQDEFGVLSVCTTPERFPEMWGWLRKRSWDVERDMGGGKVLLSKRRGLREV